MIDQEMIDYLETIDQTTEDRATIDQTTIKNPHHSALFARRMEDQNPSTILILSARRLMKTVQLHAPSY